MGKTIARIEVPKSLRLVATAEGLLQRRRLQADGAPQCVPFHPHEFASRQSDLGVLDSNPGGFVEGVTLENLLVVEPKSRNPLLADAIKRLGQGADYVRQAGFDPIQQEQMVLQYVRAQGRIMRSEAAELCRLGSEQAKHLLTRTEEKRPARSDRDAERRVLRAGAKYIGAPISYLGAPKKALARCRAENRGIMLFE